MAININDNFSDSTSPSKDDTAQSLLQMKEGNETIGSSVKKRKDNEKSKGNETIGSSVKKRKDNEKSQGNEKIGSSGGDSARKATRDDATKKRRK